MVENLNGRLIKGAIRITLILLVPIFFLFFIYNFIIFTSANSATIWTTDIYGNPKTDFLPNSIVYIQGSNFLENKNVDISITRPDGLVDKSFTKTDSLGNFVYNYQLNGIEGLYTVFATDSTNTAGTIFTDSYEVNTVCRDYGFDFGVVKWEWNNTWLPEYGDPKGTSVTGNDTVANWNVGTSDADGIVVKAGQNLFVINGQSGTVYQDKPAMSFIAFCGYNKCEENEELIEYYYESRPNSVYIDNKTKNVSYKLCNGTQYIDLDVSDGKKHYIYTKWNLDLSQYDGAYYFDLFLYHKESSALIKVQLKNKTGDWIDVCDPIESSSYIWSNCSLLSYWSIMKETPVIELRIVAWKVGTCHEYLGCVKLKTKLYRCEITEYCGDGKVKPPEQCELPNTFNNSFCPQSTTECLGKKLGQRDAYGDCDSVCGCVYDPFQYSCVKDQCGAECDDDADCQNKCVDDILYYEGNCLDNCECSWTTQDCNLQDGCYVYGNGCEQRDYYCTVEGCQYNYSDRYTDYVEDFVFYCSDSTVRKHRMAHDFYCNDFCSDHTSWIDDQLVEDCDLKDRWYDTGETQWLPVGECAEKEQKKQEYRDYTCKDAACDDYNITEYRWVDTGNMKYKDFSTPCEADGKFCTVDHCDGNGNCVFWKDYDCSDYNLDEIATCFWNPDSFDYTFDYSPPFISVCDEEKDECTQGSYSFTHTCADNDLLDGGPIIPASNGIRNCSAECDYFGIECQNKCIDNIRYYDGSCENCFCDYKTEDCDSKDGCYIYPEPEGNGCEDRDYFCELEGCDYTFSNRSTDYTESEEYYCSDSEIRSHKKFHDFYCEATCKDHTSWIEDQLIEDCDEKDGWYDTGNKRWINISQCAEKEEKEQEYRDYTCYENEIVGCNYNVNDTRWVEIGNINNYPISTPCEADQDPCTIDHCDGEGSCVTYDYVPAPSKPVKVIGEPKFECEENDWCEWKITILTPILLYCENDTQVKWRYALDGEWKEWQVNSSPVTIYFPEESNHTLEAYCIGVCGESGHDIEKFKVEGTAFEILLYKKWNLISVPFTLFDSSPETVFKNITDKIVSVWTYDPSECPNDGWCVWTPENGNLDEIKPGWGYWVIAKDDTKLLIAGSLFSPATTPPIRTLQQGWNLIGYYGTEWQTYKIESDNCGYNNYKYGDYVYCALNSLIDTQQGFPRWSSLWGYDNCGNDLAYWHKLEVCFNGDWVKNKMFAGKGYWIEMDVKDSYAPATNCMWSKNLKCLPNN